MAQFTVYNMKREPVGEVELPDTVFGTEVKEHLFWEVVRWQLAKRRAGTAKTKERSEVRGGGRKPYRQKGTGRARQGSERAPNHVGGGTVFGPRPRSYYYRLPKKVRRGALRSALSLKARDERLVIVDRFELESHKTRGLVEALSRFDVESALLVDGENRNLSLSSRNLEKIDYLNKAGLNVYDILRHDHLIMSKDAALDIAGRLGK